MAIKYKTRIKAVFYFLLILYFCVIAKVYVIQIRDGDFYKKMARNQYLIVKEVTPPRAMIYDRENNPLALNIFKVSAFITPSKIKNLSQLKDILKIHFPETLKKLERNSRTHFLFLKRALSDREIKTLKELDAEDIYFLKEPGRFYPSSCLSHIVGLTDIDNKGLFGIEATCENILTGIPTKHFLEKDARSGLFYFKKETTLGKSGEVVKLTIDPTLQFLAYEEVKEMVEKHEAKDGAAIILDPINGNILAMAQYPNFDLEDRSEVNLENTKNRCLTEAYEFGSVIKVFLALAALEEGVVTTDEFIDCEDKKTVMLDGIKIGTHKAHGVLTFSEVIEKSNNIGTSKVAKRLGPLLYDHYIDCGFHQKSGLNWPGEQKGFVNPPYLWSVPSVFSLSFGYEIRANLLQLARAFSVVATNKLINLRIILEPNKKGKKDIKDLPDLYKQETIDQVKEILFRAVEQGTGKRARIKGFKVFGKTGTARLIINGKYSQDNILFSFAGLIEKGDYKRVIVTMIKESKNKFATSATVTAPLFKNIAKKMLIHEKVMQQ